MALYDDAYTVCKYSINGIGAERMNSQSLPITQVNPMDLQQWQAFLSGRAALLALPGGHHKALIAGAHALHRARLIDDDGLGDLLELADCALAFAIEAMLDIDCEQ